jgi:hypothetical protein
MQPFCSQFFELCHHRNVTIPFSGITVRVSERSEMHSVVAVAAEQLGKTFTTVFAPISWSDGPTKQGADQLVIRTGTTLPDSKAIFPLMRCLGGPIDRENGGSGDRYMVDLNDRIPARRGDLAEWSERYVNAPEQQGRHTNFFFFQGTKVARGIFPNVINLTGSHANQPDLMRPYINDPDMLGPDDQQHYPGAAFNAWVLSAKERFKTSIVRPPAPDGESFNSLRGTLMNSAMAVVADTRLPNHKGEPEWYPGNHLRGPRTDDMLAIDSGRFYS